MAFTSNLIDFNGYSSEFTDLDADSPDNQLNINEFEDKSWPEGQGNFDTSPILDSNIWIGFQAGNVGVTKLVSSEEDLISRSDCSSPELMDKEVNVKRVFDNKLESENWEKDFAINLNNHNISEDMDHLNGFASNEVITIGDYGYDDDAESSPGSHNKTMADQWSSNEYDTVLRINNSNNKTFQANISKNDLIRNSETRSYPNKKKDGAVIAEENMCLSCNERVYITERLVIDNNLYHRKCFKCTKCRRILSMNNFAANGGRLFCKPHFLEMFRQSGKYDEIDRITDEAPISNLEKENITGDVSKESLQTDELPPPQITRSIVEKFRQLESTTGTESLLPRQSAGQLNTKCYQSTNIDRDLVNDDDSEEAIDELPTPGITKNLLSLWTNIENKSHHSSAGETPKKLNKINSQLSNVSFQSFDVIRHDDYVEDNYPAPNTTKSLAAMFKGDTPKSVLHNQSNSNIYRNSSVNKNVQCQNINHTIDIVSSSTPNDDWLQCRVSNPDQGSENHPFQRSDVVRNESKNEVDEFPEQGITRSLVGLFKSMEVKR